MRFLVFVFCFVIFQINFICAQSKSVFVVPDLKNSIYDGVFTGNGLLGTMTYQKSPNTLRIDVGRTDVYDHRKDGNYVLFSTPRLPIGHFALQFNSNFNSNGIIDMEKAYALANLSIGTQVKTISLSDKDVIIISVRKQFEDQHYEFSFIPADARSPRYDFEYTEKPKHYDANPSPKNSYKDDIFYTEQSLLAGGGYVTAYRQLQKGVEDIYIATIKFSSQNVNYISEAFEELKSIDIQSLNQGIDEHTKWWKMYNQKSTYSIPDSSLQTFYDMQLYKLASATRADKPALDLQGPWTSSTPWPGYWYNLNMQLTYSPLYTANRLDIASSLIAMIDRNKEQLVKNVPEEYQYNSAGIGRISGPRMESPILLRANDTTVYKDEFVEMTNLTWLLYYYYQHYRHSMNKDMKYELYDLLKRSVNYSIHLLKKNPHGKYEFVVKSHSPEYPKSYDYNTNYDLSNLRWGLKTLQELGTSYKNEKNYLREVKEIESNLIDYPVDNTGLMISSNQSYDVSHRHYSHLLMIYPYYLLHNEQFENVELIKKSVEHWQSKKGALQGYSLSGAASIYAMMGDGDKALDYLKRLHTNFVQPNTLYKESGPVIETPLAMAQSLQELSLQYWNGILRIFPSIPSNWKNVSFENFLADGALLVSATYADGNTREINLTAQKDIKFKLKSPITKPKITFLKKGKVKHLDGDLYSIHLKEGDSVLLIAN